MMRAFAWIFMALTLGYLCPASTAQARGCVGNWDYSVGSLQEARRRIKSPAHRNIASRVECGTDVIDALAQAQWTDECPLCRMEYINLLRDLIQHVRVAAENSTPKNSLAYYKLEIETRITLGNFLVNTKDPKMIDQYWSDNFEGMGDAMDRSNQGREFNAAVLLNHDRTLSEKSFGTWVKAIRSCQAWDFRRGENLDSDSLRHDLLCTDECRKALTHIWERAQSGQAPDKKALADYLDSQLPALDQCPTPHSP